MNKTTLFRRLQFIDYTIIFFEQKNNMTMLLKAFFVNSIKDKNKISLQLHSTVTDVNKFFLFNIILCFFFFIYLIIKNLLFLDQKRRFKVNKLKKFHKNFCSNAEFIQKPTF